jgi:hypothetical protein
MKTKTRKIDAPLPSDELVRIMGNALTALTAAGSPGQANVEKAANTLVDCAALDRALDTDVRAMLALEACRLIVAWQMDVKLNPALM